MNREQEQVNGANRLSEYDSRMETVTSDKDKRITLHTMEEKEILLQVIAIGATWNRSIGHYKGRSCNSNGTWPRQNTADN